MLNESKIDYIRLITHLLFFFSFFMQKISYDVCVSLRRNKLCIAIRCINGITDTTHIV